MLLCSLVVDHSKEDENNFLCYKNSRCFQLLGIPKKNLKAMEKAQAHQTKGHQEGIMQNGKEDLLSLEGNNDLPLHALKISRQSPRF